MKEELYQWMKNLAVFYILLTSLLHLVPGKEYQRYIRLFMGLVLIFMLSAPVFSILGKGEQLAESFQMHYQQETTFLEQQEAEHLQERYLEKGYLAEIQKQIKEALQKRTIDPVFIEVQVEEKQVTAVIYLKEKPNQEQEGMIADGLMEACQIGRGQYQIKIAAHEPSAMDGGSAAGTSSGGSGTAGVS